MTAFDESARIAVIGAGLAGAACAASLRQSGFAVEVFDKSRGVGGRMATRRVFWPDPQGGESCAELDHGVQHFSARHPRFKARMASAEAAGCVADWRPRVYAPLRPPTTQLSFVPLPNMPALCRHVLGDLPVHREHLVQRLHRDSDGWHLSFEGGATPGPFDQVMLAMPAPQAALLLAGHHDVWADALVEVRMAARWTLLAVTGDVHWPWDAAIPEHGPLDWVARNDRKPGRAIRRGFATWVAHASAQWSAAHLEDDPLAVVATLGAALRELLPDAKQVPWHHASARRWRYAAPVEGGLDSRECWWDTRLGLGVCGDFFGAGTVEAAWRSGDELADTVAAALDAPQETGWACAASNEPASPVRKLSRLELPTFETVN